MKRCSVFWILHLQFSINNRNKYIIGFREAENISKRSKPTMAATLKPSSTLEAIRNLLSKLAWSSIYWGELINLVAKGPLNIDSKAGSQSNLDSKIPIISWRITCLPTKYYTVICKIMNHNLHIHVHPWSSKIVI